jgi:hypothetical protein
MLLAKEIRKISVFWIFVDIVCATFYTTVKPMGLYTCFVDNPTAVYDFVTKSQCISACNSLDKCRFLNYVDEAGSSKNGSCQLYTFKPHFYALITNCQSYRVG